MRLLEYRNGAFKAPVTRVGSLPRYAVLSHTWGPDADEVTYKDLVDGTGDGKAGYEKIRFCAKQAQRDGLRYIWVDTCCIDKTNSTELQEAITSMFQWYKKADRCYVYLSDVAAPEHKDDDDDDDDDNDEKVKDTWWEPAFRASRWFTRGWTLQELVAPASVEFFTRNGQRLGDKRSLEQPIHEITGIALSALRGTDLAQFDVEERFKWAEKRLTTREEDWAYCLLGIFGVFLPLIYGEGKAHAVRRLNQEIANAARHNNAPGHEEARKRTWMVPFERNRSFTSRVSELAWLRQALSGDQQTSKVAITGLGGVGKTQLALELVYRMSAEQEHCSVLWMPATTKEALEQAYRNAAKQLGITGGDDDEPDAKRLVQEHLSSERAGAWLLVFDNADNIGMWVDKPTPESGRLIDRLPKSRSGSIVFTTRDKKAAVKLAGRNVLTMTEMDEPSGRQLLQNYLLDQDLLLHSQGDVASALLTRLTYLPLAIVQAAAYINENSIGLGDYLALLDEKEEYVIDLLSTEFEDEGRYVDIQNPVATTWLISFEQIRQRDPLAADYLSFAACVDAKDIPLSLLPPGLSPKQETDAMGTLQGYSFITKQPANAAITIHRLVHLATKNWLRKEGLLSDWADRAMQRLAEVLVRNAEGDYDRREARAYMPHAYAILMSDLGSEDSNERIQLLSNYGECFYRDAQYAEAEALYKRLLEINKAKFGACHLNTLYSMMALAMALRRRGRLDEAETLLVRAVETSRAQSGRDIRSGLGFVVEFAEMLEERGRLAKAEALQVQAMETATAKLGPDDLLTLRSKGDVASICFSQNRFAEAETLQLQVLAATQARLGPTNSNTLTCIHNLASTLWQMGRFEEADKLAVQIIETSRTTLGADHPTTLDRMAGFARGLAEQGRWEEAEQRCSQVLAARKIKLGLAHPQTLNAMADLAILWKCQARHAEAGSMMAACVEASQSILGPAHSFTQNCLATNRAWHS